MQVEEQWSCSFTRRTFLHEDNWYWSLLGRCRTVSQVDGKDLKEHIVFEVKDKSSMSLSTTGTHLPDYMVSESRRQQNAAPSSVESHFLVFPYTPSFLPLMWGGVGPKVKPHLKIDVTVIYLLQGLPHTLRFVNKATVK